VNAILSYAQGPKLPLLDDTVYGAFARTAARQPDADALIVPFQDIRHSFRALTREVERVTGALGTLGLTPGDRVGIWARNCAEWIYLQLAAARAGLVLVNVNPAYRAAELAYVLRKSGLCALFLHERDQRSDYRVILAEAMAPDPQLPLRHVVYLGTPSWQSFVSASRPPRDPKLSADDVVNMQYTSGTTGSPKGVLLTHRNIVNNGHYSTQALHVVPGDRVIVPVPLYHCFGCVVGVMPMVTAGAVLVLPAPSFDPEATLTAIERFRGTVILGVPTMFIAQLEHASFGRRDFSSLRTGIMGGAPCPLEIMKRVVTDMHCTQMTVAYGQTESSPVITGSGALASPEARTASIGTPLPNTEVKLVDAAGATVPIGEQGELCTRGYLVMRGYDGEPEATRRAVDADGWLHTGDLATMQPDATLRITGRVKDLIIRGGENVYPREVEDFLYGNPKIGEVQVVGVPHAQLGETVAAWVRLKPGESACEEELREYCRGKIAHFKVPQYFRLVEEFPTTVTGKVQKFRIREIEMQLRGLDTLAGIDTA
jgi:fatty-acyl-CoA synthase